MKRYLVIFAFMSALMLSGCSRASLGGSGATAGVSFDVCLGESSKAASDGDGKAASVNRCILQVWQDGEIYRTVVKTAPDGTREYSFRDVCLPLGVYDFLFWADCGTSDGKDQYYSTASLRSVSLVDKQIGNIDALDAFCNSLKDYEVNQDVRQTLILRRPLAQVNVITTELPGMSAHTAFEQFVPNTVRYSYCGCTAFDVYQDTYIGNAELISVPDVPVYGTPVKSGTPSDTCTLVMTYVFPQDGESVSELSLTVTNVNGSTVNRKFDNVPFKRNWRTNIKGNIITVKGNLSVAVSPMFDGSADIQY